MEDSTLTMADLIRAQLLIGERPKPTFIGPDVALWLKREHGATDESLLGMNIKVSHAVPAGQAYVIGPPRPPIKWVFAERAFLQPAQIIRIDNIT